MPGYSTDQVQEPEIGPEPCPICGERVECDEDAHRAYGVSEAMRALAGVADLGRQTHRAGEERAPF